MVVVSKVPAAKMMEKIYGWYPPAYDMYLSANNNHFVTHESHNYRPPGVYQDEYTTLRVQRFADKRKSTPKKNLNVNLDLTISPAPRITKTSPIPTASRIWASSNLEATPITTPETSEHDTSSKRLTSPPTQPQSRPHPPPEYPQSVWNARASYTAVPCASTYDFTPLPSDKKSSPIYQKATAPYGTTLPITMKPTEFGHDNKLSPYNENILRPTTAPTFYKRGPKISLVPYKPKPTSVAPKVSVPHFTPTHKDTKFSHAKNATKTRSVPLKCSSTPPPHASLKIDTTPRRCSSAPAGLPSHRQLSSRLRSPTPAPVIEETREPDHHDEQTNERVDVVIETGQTEETDAHEEAVEESQETGIQEEQVCDDKSTTDEDERLPYDEAVSRYGWRAQVPGDPYGLIKLEERPVFTFTRPDPEIPPDPPVARAVNFNTFFMNTIPRRPQTYVIHKEWASEQLLAKRLQLQQRHSKYQFKKYGFVY